MASLSSGSRSDEIGASTLLSPSCLVSGRARSDSKERVIRVCWNERTGEDRALGCLLVRPRSSNLATFLCSELSAGSEGSGSKSAGCHPATSGNTLA